MLLRIPYQLFLTSDSVSEYMLTMVGYGCSAAKLFFSSRLVNAFICQLHRYPLQFITPSPQHMYTSAILTLRIVTMLRL